MKMGIHIPVLRSTLTPLPKVAEKMVTKDLKDTQDPMDPQDSQDQRDLMEKMAHKDQKAHQVILDQRVIME